MLAASNPQSNSPGDFTSKRLYTNEEYLEFFSREVRKYSDNAVDIVWSQELGFHTIALRKIKKDDYFLWIPAKYVLTVCKYIDYFIIKSGGEFEYKDLIVRTIRSIRSEKQSQEQAPQQMILGMRLLAAWKEHGTLPLKEIPRGTRDDQQFLHMILSYYAQIKNDDFPLWNEQQVAYYKRHGLPFDVPLLREYHHKNFMQALANDTSPEAARFA